MREGGHASASCLVSAPRRMYGGCARGYVQEVPPKPTQNKKPRKVFMEYDVKIKGVSPIIHHNAAGMDPRLPINREIQEITKGATASKRSDAEHELLARLECRKALWLDPTGTKVQIPEGAIRSCIERAARKFKDGPRVREGLMVLRCEPMEYDVGRYGSTVEEISEKAQFTVPVKVGQSRVLRTRAKFDDWACRFRLFCEPELIDEGALTKWLDTAGSRCGIGDWRPEKSGIYGRFELDSLEAQE